MDFFQHEAYLHARVPRVKCPEHGVHQIPVPWAREGSRFTLLFEALIMTLVREMPVLTVARLIGESDTLLWRVIDHYVPEARTRVDMSDVHAVGVDETSSRRGHDYITLFVDLEARRLLFATPGKDATTFERFAADLEAHGGDTSAITDVSMDLSPAFQKGAKEHLPNAQVTFDRFHLMKLVNEAVDAVRNGEVLTQPDLKKTRWLWLKNDRKLKVKQKEKLQELLKDQNLKTAQAYQFRLTFQDIFTIKNRHQGATLLKAWMENAKNSGLSPMVKVAYTLAIDYLEKNAFTYLFAWANPSIYSHVASRIGVPFWVVDVPVNKEAVYNDRDWINPPVGFFIREKPPTLLISILPFWDFVKDSLQNKTRYMV